jgi:hypothetical protein
MPDRSMGAHYYHAVDKGNPQQIKIKILEYEYEQTGNEQHYPGPAGKGQPVLPGPENIQTENEFF